MEERELTVCSAFVGMRSWDVARWAASRGRLSSLILGYMPGDWWRWLLLFAIINFLRFLGGVN